MALQIRRGLENERTAGGGVVFAEGELVYVTDTDALYVGDGSTAGGVKLTDNAGAVLGSYITADTVSSTLDLQQNLDLNGKDIIGTGNINIAGTINATGNVNIGDDVNTDTVDFAAKITSGLTPNADSTYNIGTTTARWNNGYFTGLVVDGQVDAVAVNADVVADNSTVMVDVSTNIFAGALTGNVTGNVLGDLTGDSAGTHTGAVVGNTTGYHTGDVKGSVFGDDSTVLVDAVNNTLSGNLTGNVVGNVTGDVTGNVTGSVKGSGGSAVLAPNAGPADAVLSILDITATGTIGGNLTGNVTGDAAGDHTGTFAGVITATGTFDGDITGSVFGDDSTLIVDAINKTLIGNVTGNVTGDTAGVHTGNIFTNLIDSADSSAIIVTPVFQVESDLIASNALIVGTGNVAGPGGPNVILKNTGEILANTITASSIGAGSAAVEFNVISKLGLKERAAFEKAASFQDAVSVQTIAGAFTGSFAVETFTGDPESDAEIADVSNYNKHFEATTTKVSFGVPAQMAVVADDSARGTLVPSPAAGMMLFMTAGSAPSATTQLQVYNGSAWVNV
jgi:hypothetical protein